MKKKIMAAGLAVMMAAGMSMSAFAAEAAMTVFGQKPVLAYSDTNGFGAYTFHIERYDIYLDGATSIRQEDRVVNESGWQEYWYADFVSASTEPADILEASSIENQRNTGSIQLFRKDGNDTYSQTYYFYYIPENYDRSLLGENAKYIINAKNTSSVPQAEKTASWAQNDIGWWIQYSDGSYLTDAWYQSPASGLWYYMGSDGYMLTDCWTPDGYYVNADGAWVQ